MGHHGKKKSYVKNKEDTNRWGNPYDRDEWRYQMPKSAEEHLKACFDHDGYNVYHLKRAIELSIEHYTREMVDDAECARIIEERLGKSLDMEEFKKYRKNQHANETE